MKVYVWVQLWTGTVQKMVTPAHQGAKTAAAACLGHSSTLYVQDGVQLPAEQLHRLAKEKGLKVTNWEFAEYLDDNDEMRHIRKLPRAACVKSEIMDDQQMVRVFVRVISIILYCWSGLAKMTMACMIKLNEIT